MLEKIKHGLCLIEEVRVTKMETFIKERIKTEQVNIWATMQKVRLQTRSAFLKKCTCSNIKQSFRIKRRQRVTSENCRQLSP